MVIVLYESLDIWIKAYSTINRKTAFYVEIDNSRHYWRYDEGQVKMDVVSCYAC